MPTPYERKSMVHVDLTEALLAVGEILAPREEIMPDTDRLDTVVKWSDQLNAFTLEESEKAIDAVPATWDNTRYFDINDYGKIFPGYNPDTDRVSFYVRGGNSSSLVLKRKMKVKADPIPPGLYEFKSATGREPPRIAPFGKIFSDDYIDLGSPVQKLSEDLLEFYSKEADYQKAGLNHKRGALVYGPPGNGKSLEILRISQNIAQHKGIICIWLSNDSNTLFDLGNFRQALSNYHVIFIVEEITDRSRYGPEELLNFLDGAFSWKSAYTIATTNYPQDLEENLINRPGRFDLILEVENPKAEVRRAYMERTLNAEVSPALLEATDGFSIAHLREVSIKTRIEGIPPIKAAHKIKNMYNQIRKHISNGAESGYI
ncbi:MAG: AAA family ATPase [Candidatus Altiarchaeales archaeon]|nr:AAA family ATPase [Candidatus Altiarchaeales archaeon]